MSDLISREDAIEAIASHDTTNGDTVYFKGKTVIGYIMDLPSAEPVDCTDFIHWIRDKVMDEEDWETNAVAYGEVIARKLKKLGAVFSEGGYYHSTEHGEWIPVSERLPSEDGKYLVFYEGIILGSEIDIMWYGEPLLPNVDVSGKHFYRSDGEWGDVIYDEVIAWMPLPEPYKGGETESEDE